MMLVGPIRALHLGWWSPVGFDYKLEDHQQLCQGPGHQRSDHRFESQSQQWISGMIFTKEQLIVFAYYKL